MKAHRIAAGLLFIFCVMHTAGGMLAQKSLGPASDVVFASMKAVHFDFNGADSTWYGFWFGFGLMASAFLLFSAVAAWQLDRLPPVVAWSLVAAQAFNAFISWRYFFAGPGAFATVVAALLAYSALKPSRAPAPASAHAARA